MSNLKSFRKGNISQLKNEQILEKIASLPGINKESVVLKIRSIVSSPIHEINKDSSVKEIQKDDLNIFVKDGLDIKEKSNQQKTSENPEVLEDSTMKKIQKDDLNIFVEDGLDIKEESNQQETSENTDDSEEMLVETPGVLKPGITEDTMKRWAAVRRQEERASKKREKELVEILRQQEKHSMDHDKNDSSKSGNISQLKNEQILDKVASVPGINKESVLPQIRSIVSSEDSTVKEIRKHDLNIFVKDGLDIKEESIQQETSEDIDDSEEMLVETRGVLKPGINEDTMKRWAAVRRQEERASKKREKELIELLRQQEKHSMDHNKNDSSKSDYMDHNKNDSSTSDNSALQSATISSISLKRQHPLISTLLTERGEGRNNKSSKICTKEESLKSFRIDSGKNNESSKITTKDFSEDLKSFRNNSGKINESSKIATDFSENLKSFRINSGRNTTNSLPNDLKSFRITPETPIAKDDISMLPTFSKPLLIPSITNEIDMKEHDPKMFGIDVNSIFNLSSTNDSSSIHHAFEQDVSDSSNFTLSKRCRIEEKSDSELPSHLTPELIEKIIEIYQALNPELVRKNILDEIRSVKYDFAELHKRLGLDSD